MLSFALQSTRSILQSGVELGRYPKRFLLVINDVIVLTVSLWLAFSVRYSMWFIPPTWDLAAVMAAAPVIGVVTLFYFGVYRVVTRFMGGRTVNLIAVAIGLSTLIWALLILLSGVQGVPRVAVFIYAFFATIGIWGSRQIAGWLLKSTGTLLHARPDNKRLPVIIYGASAQGIMLASALERSERYVPFGFVDRTVSMWGQYVGGYKVYRPERLGGLISRWDIKEVLVALPQAQRSERVSVLQELEKHAVLVRTLPVIDDIATGRVTVSDLRPVDATDLLGRDPVPPHEALMTRNIIGKSVLVTGAGGSIGSELCRQILRLRPRQLVLLDVSENALYEIESKLTDTLAEMQRTLGPGDALPNLRATLGSVLDEAMVAQTIEHFQIETIFHAAAYKHVPIIERNPLKGIENNTFGTLAIAAIAARLGVERFVLISTDKAVRPTNVMGASKRLAELVLQSLASNPSTKTVFTMVRFGNVLDSSGSVVKRFRQQIAAGGPVTVTHPEIIRYFMSIPEAASLVIQAGAMAKGGEVFVLDMGEPVKIDDLARAMIGLSGLSVRQADNPDGDIAIEYIGLRPGEKIKEELLIGHDTKGTEHPRIQTSQEPYLPANVLESELARLKDAIAKDDMKAVHAVLLRTVEGYRANGDAKDRALAGSDSLGYAWTATPSKALH